MKINIHYKITLLIAFTSAVILSGVYLYLNNNLKLHTYQRIYERLKKDTILAVSYLQHSFPFSSTITEKAIDKIAGQIGEDLNVRVTIIDMKGRVLGDSELSLAAVKKMENHLYRPEVQSALKMGFGDSRRFSTTIHKDMLYMAAPFRSRGLSGVVRLAIPLSEIQLVSEKLKSLLLFALVAAFVFSWIIGLAISGLVSKPIREISSVARAIADGNYDRKITFSTGDEIEELADAVNHMSIQIKTKIEELTLNKSKFEAVLMSMAEGVMVVNANGQILLINKSLRKWFNLDDTIVNRSPIEAVRNVNLQDIIDELLQRGKNFVSRQISVFMPDEKIFQVQAAAVIRDNEIDGAVMVFHDITELRRLENIRRDFVANVSHELRSPVTNIKGYAETLLEGALNDKKNAIDFLKIISSDSDRLSRLVDDLLELSKIESGKLTLNMQPVNILEVINKVISILSKNAKEKKVTIEKNIQSDIVKIISDEELLLQLIFNIADNAVKYNKEGGRVIITVADAGDIISHVKNSGHKLAIWGENSNTCYQMSKDTSPANVKKYIQIEIRDTGIGISDEDLPRIFERFYRVDKARSRRLKGTGLGLSIAKHIVSVLNGDILVRTELGRGSIFTIILPVMQVKGV